MNSFVWLAAQDNIPSIINIAHRNVTMMQFARGIEDTQYLLFGT